MNFLYKESECNFCNSSTKKLLVGNLSPVNLIFSVQGAGLRFGRCLNCNSTARERLLLSYLQRIDFTIDQLCIVHFAPELKIEEFLKKMRRNNIFSYLKFDKFMPGYNYSNDVVNMDLSDIDLPDNTVDILLCCHVLEHVDNLVASLEEIKRVLTIGGTAVVNVPFSRFLNRDLSLNTGSNLLRYFFHGQWDHKRLFSLRDLLQKLDSIGFTSEIIDFSELRETLTLDKEFEIIQITKTR